MSTVSIIIPVYNVEKYIDRCLNSLHIQTYKKIEVLVVDDGSTDSTLSKVKEHIKRDNRIRIIRKENGGVSSARNVGIDEAKGKYMMFVDGDDWLSRGAIKILVDKIESTQSDICYGASIRVQNRANVPNTKIKNILTGKNELLYLDFIESIESTPWAKLFVTDIIRANKLYFPLGVAYGEDAIFVYKYLKCCSTFASVSTCVYYYNCLNMQNASNKYYPNINQWLAENLAEFEKLFDKYQFGAEANNVKVGRALNLFDLSNKHYLLNENKIGKDEVVRKLEESYNLFSKYIVDLDECCFSSDYLSNCKNKYSALNNVADFNYLYISLKNDFPTRKCSAIKKFLLQVYNKAKCWVLFKTKIDYLYD